MSPEEKRAYARGYNARKSHLWPSHVPPVPPNEIVKELMDALTVIRNGVDAELSQFGPDDEWERRLGPLIDRADAALLAVSEWIQHQ